MSTLSFSKNLSSPARFWIEIEQRHWSPAAIVLLLLLPFSLLPPLMLYYAGTHYGDQLIVGFSSKPWDLIAMLLLPLELFSFGGMLVLVKSIINTYDIGITSYRVLLLNTISTLPLLLSSLALIVPNLAFNVLAVALALCTTCWLLYHGVRALAQVKEELFAARLVYIAVSVGIIWIFAMALMVTLV